MKKTGRNEPCPCGSGKKYKNCCLGKQPPFTTITSYYRQFKPDELLIGLQCIACHASNEKFLHRFEHLLALLFTIPVNEFGHATPQKNDFDYFFETIDALHKKQFAGIEDYDGFDQSKLIPLIWEKEYFYFFYSGLERPYEYWKHLIEVFFSIDCTEDEAISLKQQLKESLRWQTSLLNELAGNPENETRTEKVYVPSQLFIDEFSGHFRTTTSSDNYMLFGSLVSYTDRLLAEKAPYVSEVFHCSLVKYNKGFIYLAPQLHYPVFLREGTSLLRDNAAFKFAVFDAFKERLVNQCIHFFKPYRHLRKLLQPGTDIDLVENISDCSILFDYNKLLIFTAVPHAVSNGITDEITAVRKNISTCINNIRQEEMVGLYMGSIQPILGINPKNLEIISVIVLETLSMDYYYALSNDESWEHTWYFEYMDLRAVFEKLEGPADFYKFIQEDKWLQSTVEFPVNAEFIDRFACFIRNNYSYSKMADLPDMIYFAHHQWSGMYNEEQYQKYLQGLPLYLEIEKKAGEYFDNVEIYRKNVYRLTHTKTFGAAYIGILPEQFIWVFLMQQPRQLQREQFRYGYEVIAPMFADYLSRMAAALTGFLQTYGIDHYSIHVLPVEYEALQQREFAFLQTAIEAINEGQPYMFITTKPSAGQEAETYFLYKHGEAFKVFESPQNDGERTLIRELLESIVDAQGGLVQAVGWQIGPLVESALPPGNKGYSVDAMILDNPEIGDYDAPVETSLTDRGVVKRLIAAFLKSKGYQPGKYSGDPAKTICFEVYVYLQQTLETDISSYNYELIIYAYKQLELNEGRVELRKINAGKNTFRVVDYDVLEKLKRDLTEDMAISSEARYILHTCLKVDTSGQKFPTDTDWSYLTALATEIIQAAMNYDYIQYKLREHVIEINEYFEVHEFVESENFSMHSYLDKDAERKMALAVKSYEKASKEFVLPEDRVAESQPGQEPALDAVFHETYGVRYEHLVLVLYVLSKMRLELTRDFPVYLCSKEELLNAINQNLKEPFDLETLAKITAFLTLHVGVYPSDKWLYHEILMREKNRLTLCPLIKLKDETFVFAPETIDGSMRLWSSVQEGWPPFDIGQGSALDSCLKNIRGANALELENKADDIAREVLGNDFSEKRIDNFKRLSPAFERRENCGEIDLLCINPIKQVVFVFDCKNHLKKIGLYQVRRNLEEFFFKKNANYKKLLEKKEFVIQNLPAILGHFGISDTAGWVMKEAFIVTTLQFAGFYAGIKADFILLDDLADYLRNSH